MTQDDIEKGMKLPLYFIHLDGTKGVATDAKKVATNTNNEQAIASSISR